MLRLIKKKKNTIRKREHTYTYSKIEKANGRILSSLGHYFENFDKMDKFLEKYNLKLIQEKVESLNSSKTIKYIEIVV